MVLSKIWKNYIYTILRNLKILIFLACQTFLNFAAQKWLSMANKNSDSFPQS